MNSGRLRVLSNNKSLSLVLPSFFKPLSILYTVAKTMKSTILSVLNIVHTVRFDLRLDLVVLTRDCHHWIWAGLAMKKLSWDSGNRCMRIIKAFCSTFTTTDNYSSVWRRRRLLYLLYCLEILLWIQSIILLLNALSARGRFGEPLTAIMTWEARYVNDSSDWMSSYLTRQVSLGETEDGCISSLWMS